MVPMRKRKTGTYTARARSVKRARYTLPAMKTKLPMQIRATKTKAMLVYSDLGRQLTGSPAGATTSYVYSLNGPYDPDVTGVGGQPTGFDQYMNLYEFAIVTKARVKVTCLNLDTTSVIGLVGCNIASTSGTSSDPNVYMRNMNMWNTVLEKRGSYRNSASYEFSVDISQLSTKNVLQESDYQTTVSSNPANQWYLIIWSCNSDVASTGPNTQWQVTIEYETHFKDAATTANS